MDDQASTPDLNGSETGRVVVALRCPCGLELVGNTEDALVTVAKDHLAVEHPRLAGAYGPEDILSLSYRRASSRR